MKWNSKKSIFFRKILSMFLCKIFEISIWNFKISFFLSLITIMLTMVVRFMVNNYGWLIYSKYKFYPPINPVYCYFYTRWARALHESRQVRLYTKLFRDRTEVSVPIKAEPGPNFEQNCIQNIELATITEYNIKNYRKSVL